MNDVFDPGSTGIDQHLCLNGLRCAALAVFETNVPQLAHPFGFGNGAAAAHGTAALLGVAGVEQNQPAVFNPAI